jgi:hypothetical protein
MNSTSDVSTGDETNQTVGMIRLVAENRVEILLGFVLLHMSGLLTTASETVGGCI